MRCLLLLLLLAGCTGFEIRYDDRVLINDSDVLAYNMTSQSLILTPEAQERLDFPPTLAMGGMYRKEFEVIIDGRKRYEGEFWTAVSSQSSDGPVIDLLQAQVLGIIRIAGYPGGEPIDDAPLRKHFKDRLV